MKNLGYEKKLYEQNLIRFEKIDKLCKGNILNLGSSNIDKHSSLNHYLKKRHKKVYSASLTRADFIQDLNNEKWEIKGKYNTIIAGEIIEHIENPSLFLKNCHRYLKENGRLILSTPNATSLIYLKNPNWCITNIKKIREDNPHLHTFTSGMIVNLLKELNFKNIKYEYLNCFIFNPFGYIIAKFIPRLRGDILIFGDK